MSTTTAQAFVATTTTQGGVIAYAESGTTCTTHLLPGTFEPH